VSIRTTNSDDLCLPALELRFVFSKRACFVCLKMKGILYRLRRPNRNCCLILFNTFFTICGVILLIIAGIVDSYFGGRTQIRGTFFVQDDTYWGIFAGILMILTSLSGIYAIQNQLKHLMFAYVLSMVLVLCLQMAFSNSLDGLSKKFEIQEKVASGALSHISDVEINNAVFSVYTKCCSGCPSGCNNTNPASFSPVVLPNCANSLCEFVGACESHLQDKCFNYFRLPGQFLRPNVELPPDAIDDSVCTVLSRLSYGSQALVGPVQQGGCGMGDARNFHLTLALYVSARTYGCAIAVGFLVAIELIVMLVSMYLVFCAKTISISSRSVEDEEEAQHHGVLLQNT